MRNNPSIDLNSPDGPLEARLRALPQPGVPADLERRLLADIPRHRPIASRRWLAASGVCGILMAACLLIAFNLSRSGAPRPVAAGDGPPRLADRPKAGAAVIPDGHARPYFDSSKPPKFAWPLAGAPSLAASSVRAVSFDGIH